MSTLQVTNLQIQTVNAEVIQANTISLTSSDITVSGNVTATALSGNGALLTSVTPADGSVTADKLNSTLDLSGKTISNFATTGIDDNASTTSLVIDSNGYVTKPYTPAFHVKATAFTLDINEEVDAVSGARYLALNNGNHFSDTTLLFTAPVSGLYVMYVNVTRSKFGGSSGVVRLYKNQIVVSQTLNYNAGYNSAISMATLQLAANDTVRGTFADANDNDTDIYTAYFGGYLIG